MSSLETESNFDACHSFFLGGGRLSCTFYSRVVTDSLQKRFNVVVFLGITYFTIGGFTTELNKDSHSRPLTFPERPPRGVTVPLDTRADIIALEESLAEASSFRDVNPISITYEVRQHFAIIIPFLSTIAAASSPLAASSCSPNTCRQS